MEKKKRYLHLSEREIQVLRLVVAGHTDVEISTMLDISFFTARRHRENLMCKSGVSKAVQLISMYFVELFSEDFGYFAKKG